MKGDVLYWFLANELNQWVWSGELIDWENLPVEYPVVFVSNHAAAIGPIAVMSSLSVRVYPWVISDMMEWDKAAKYLRMDFIEPQLHVPPLMSWGGIKITLTNLRSFVVGSGMYPRLAGRGCAQNISHQHRIPCPRKKPVDFP